MSPEFSSVEAKADAINTAIGAELRVARIEKQISFEDLGKVTGISRRTLSRIFKGERAVDMVQISLLATALGTSVQAITQAALRRVDGRWESDTLEALQEAFPGSEVTFRHSDADVYQVRVVTVVGGKKQALINMVRSELTPALVVEATRLAHERFRESGH